MLKKPRTAEEITEILYFANERTKRQHSEWNEFNLLTNFWSWIALTGKMLGEGSSGKAVLCSSTFTYFFDSCYMD